MSEREIRDAIQQARDRLELRARTDPKRKGGLLFFPLMVGAGLAVADCDDADTIPDNEAPYGIATTTYTGTGSGTGAGTGTGGFVVAMGATAGTGFVTGIVAPGPGLGRVVETTAGGGVTVGAGGSVTGGLYRATAPSSIASPEQARTPRWRLARARMPSEP